MTIIFKGKSDQAYRIKILAEILAHNIKTGCFVIDETGISLAMMDNNQTILIDLKLLSHEFHLYKFTSKKMFIGVSLTHFHKLTKSIKKKDNIELSIDDLSPTDLSITVIPKENNRKSTSTIKIQNTQYLDIELPTGYSHSIKVPASDFQKIIKEMSNIGSTIRVTATRYKINFACNAAGILKKTVEFGENDDDDDEFVHKIEYDQDFYSEQLCKITKLSGLDSDIQIWPGKPLLFVSNIGKLGKIAIYIKSKQQIESESRTPAIDSDYSDIE